MMKSVMIYNASGCNCTYALDLDNLNLCNSDAILTKSTTLEARDGNEKPKYYDNGIISINSNGLENLGYKFYLDYCKYKRDLKELRKPLGF